VLAVVRLAELDAGDLRDRVRLVGGLQRPGEERVFPHRLVRHPRVDAARAQEEEALHARAPRLVDHVRLDHQVLVDEVGGVRVVRVDAAHLRRGEHDGIRALALEERLDVRLGGEIELRVGARDDARGTPALERAHDRRTHHAAMARDVDLRSRVHAAIRAG
jgi:hypothetical protein